MFCRPGRRILRGAIPTFEVFHSGRVFNLSATPSPSPRVYMVCCPRPAAHPSTSFPEDQPYSTLIVASASEFSCYTGRSCRGALTSGEIDPRSWVHFDLDGRSPARCGRLLALDTISVTPAPALVALFLYCSLHLSFLSLFVHSLNRLAIDWRRNELHAHSSWASDAAVLSI